MSEILDTKFRELGFETMDTGGNCNAWYKYQDMTYNPKTAKALYALDQANEVDIISLWHFINDQSSKPINYFLLVTESDGCWIPEHVDDSVSIGFYKDDTCEEMVLSLTFKTATRLIEWLLSFM